MNTIKRSAFRVSGIAIAALVFSGLASAAQPTAAGVKDWYRRVVRVQTIARRILASNLDSCSVKKDDFGFTSMSPDSNAPDPVREAWVAGLGLGEGSTVVAVFPSGPAEAAGLQIGDHIVELNGARWSPQPEELKAFSAALTAAREVHLSAKRNGEDVALTMTAQQICSADAWLLARTTVNAQSKDMNIFIEGGLEQLLSSDDELAWVIAHEAAHVVLGHTRADRVADLKVEALRSKMERDADALSVRLMLRAGFSPEASSEASQKLAKASRGPISQLLDLHGPYMGTRERRAFLMSETAAARSEQQGLPKEP